MVSNARLLLPEPDRPVITTSSPRGMSTLTSLRLCSRAPRTRMKLVCSCMAIGSERAPHAARGSTPPFSTQSRRCDKNISGTAAGLADQLLALADHGDVAAGGADVGDSDSGSATARTAGHGQEDQVVGRRATREALGHKARHR